MKIKTLMNEDLNKQLQEEFKNLIFNYVSVKNFKGRHKTNIACALLKFGKIIGWNINFNKIDIENYFASGENKELAEATRKAYRSYIHQFANSHGIETPQQSRKKTKTSRHPKDNLMNKFNKNYKKTLILLNLHELTKDMKECFIFFNNIRNQIPKGTKYRPIEKLLPIIMYIFLKMKGFNINLNNYIKQLDINKESFKTGLKAMIKQSSKYQIRDRKKLVAKKLYLLITKLGLDDAFLKRAINILTCFWENLKTTTEDVLLCTIYTLTKIDLEIKSPSVSQICTTTGIRQSAVIYQIKNNIFKRNGIPGFKCIKNSIGLIKKIIQAKCDKLPVINSLEKPIHNNNNTNYKVYLDSTSFTSFIEREKLYLDYEQLIDYIKGHFGNEVKVNLHTNAYGIEMPVDILNIQKKLFNALKQLR